MPCPEAAARCAKAARRKRTKGPDVTARHLLCAGLLVVVAGCAAPGAAPSAPPATPAPPVAACRAGSDLMAKTELYFGLAIPGGGKVTPAQWSDFLNTEVTPRFPDGLTVDETAGQWRDQATGKTVREPSRVVMVLYTRSDQAEASIEAIRTAYKTRFRQDSVMRLDEMDCVGF